MSIDAQLGIYCLLIAIISFWGGLFPQRLSNNHRNLQFSLSFVSGLLLSLALLHFLPHSIEELGSTSLASYWLLAGLLSMFFLERFFCFHHHEEQGCSQHGHNFNWTGSLIGLSLHSFVAGLALAASLLSSNSHGFAVFMGIALHKPFDSFTIGTLMQGASLSRNKKLLLNLLFAAIVPLGALSYQLTSSSIPGFPLGAALAFSAGVFLCISLSDLLPELHFHDHDRLQLSAFLLAGIGLGMLIEFIESAHIH